MPKKSSVINVAITGDAKKLKKTLDTAERRVGAFSDNVGQSIARVGSTVGLAFAATATAVATKGVTAFAGFEKGMNEVITLLPDAGEKAFGELGDQVKDFSKEFGVLPDKTIPALYSALSAGVPKKNVFEFMEVAQKAAKGGVTELETAVDALSSVVNAYGSEAITASHSSDLLLTAVRLGKTTFEELAAEVYKVAPIAASVGVPFENLTASLAVLTSQGVPTAQSATMLKGALAELAKEGTAADTAFRDFAGEGLAAFLAGGGTFEEAIMGLATQAETAGISVLDLFGSVEAGQGILSLTSDGGAAFSSVLAEMGDSAGATQAAFETMDSGLSANFDKIKANLSVLAIDIGEKVAPVVERVSEFLIKGFEELKVIIPKVQDEVSKWATIIRIRVTPYVKKFSEAISKVVDWVRTFIKENPHSALAGLGALIAMIVIPVVWALVAAIAALFSPVILIVAAIAALAAGAVYAYENFETFRNIVDNVRDWLVNTLVPAMKVVGEKITEAFWVVVRFFQNDFVPIVEGVVETMTTIWTTLADFFTTYVKPIISAAIGVVIDVVDSLWTTVQGVYDLLKGLFTGDMALLWEGLKTMIAGVVGLIIDLFIKLPMNILNASKPLLGKFALIVSDFTVYLFNKILDLIEAIPGKIVEFMAAVGADMLQLGKDVGGWLLDGFLDVITGAASAVADAFKSLIPDWVPGWLNPFDGGGKTTSRYTTSQTNAAAALASAAAAHAAAPALNRLGGMAGQLDLSPGSTDWFQNPETIMAFRGKGLMDQFNKFRSSGDVAGMEAFAEAGWKDPAGSTVVVNVAGSVTTEAELVENIRQGLLKSQQSGKQLVL